MPSANGSSRPLARVRGRAVAVTLVAALAVALLAVVPTADAQPADGGSDPWEGATDPAEAYHDRVARFDAGSFDRTVASIGADAAGTADLAHAPLAVGDLDAPGAIPGELIVTTRTVADLEARTRAGWQSLDGVAHEGAHELADRVALVTADPDDVDGLVAALGADPAVVAVEPNVRRAFLAAPDDTSYGLQWAHQQTNAPLAWDIYTGQGGTAPLIAIIDSGVDATHPDLSGVVVSSMRSANGAVFPGTPDNDPCGIGHGTAVAGSAAAQGNNGFGVTGALWHARVIDIALTSPENDCPSGPLDSDTIAAMSFTSQLAERPWAMNLSLGASLTSCPASYQAAVGQARAAGVVVVAAAGNDSTSQTSIPASCDGVISVAATDSSGDRASYSQTNPFVDIAAPGGDLATPILTCPSFEQLVAEMVITTSLTDPVNVISGCPAYSDPSGHRLRGITGTSFAAPYVTGAIGLLRQIAADRGSPLGVDAVEAILTSTAADAGAPGRDDEFGAGILDLGAAVAAVAGSEECTVPEPTGSGDVVRFAASGPTDPICQAVAMSSAIPAGVAPHAVLARVDESADALAGSAVGFGVGPVLFTSPTEGLDGRTEAELLRVLDRTDPRVYVMGGTSAVPASVDQRLTQLGITPLRIAGAGREATAAAASFQVEEFRAATDSVTRDFAFVAFARNWPDAVAAGQMAAYYGVPILVTNRDSLHPETRAELQRLQPSRVFVLGGTAVIDDAVPDAIAGLGFAVDRLAGDGRVDTALAVSQLFLRELRQDVRDGIPGTQPRAVAINMDDNFNDILSASLIAGRGNLYLPLAGGGTTLTDPVASFFCGIGNPLLVIGGTDRISDSAAQQVAQVAAGQGC